MHHLMMSTGLACGAPRRHLACDALGGARPDAQPRLKLASLMHNAAATVPESCTDDTDAITPRQTLNHIPAASRPTCKTAAAAAHSRRA